MSPLCNARCGVYFVSQGGLWSVRAAVARRKFTTAYSIAACSMSIFPMATELISLNECSTPALSNAQCSSRLVPTRKQSREPGDSAPCSRRPAASNRCSRPSFRPARPLRPLSSRRPRTAARSAYRPKLRRQPQRAVAPISRRRFRVRRTGTRCPSASRDHSPHSRGVSRECRGSTTRSGRRYLRRSFRDRTAP
jgi:hypothetical protein